jgi:hypothetical protein
MECNGLKKIEAHIYQLHGPGEEVGVLIGTPQITIFVNLRLSLFSN